MKKKAYTPVVYIITKLELGGAQKVCLSLFHELQKKNHPTWLISGTQGTLAQSVKDNPNVILIPSLVRECSWRTIGSEIKTFFTLIKELKKLKTIHPTLIVHTHSTKAGYLGRWAGLFAGIKERIHTVHGFGFHPYQSRLGYFVAWFLEYLTSYITTQYVCVSREDIRIGKRLLHNFSKKSSLIRAAIEDHKFYPSTIFKESSSTEQSSTLLSEASWHRDKGDVLQLSDTTFIFGAVSCFKKQKNLFDLLHAFEIVHAQHPHTRLELIGDGVGRPDIEQWIKHKNLAHSVTLHGWVDDVAGIMRTWHTFVMSSLWEGLPCAAVEARFLTLPVLAYNVGGIKDLIISGQNGFLYEPQNKQQLAQGMMNLVTDKDLYKKLKLYPEDLSSFTLPAMILDHSFLYQNLEKNK